VSELKMSLQKFPMTSKGFDRLREELDHLKKVERPAVIKAISEARDHGDLSENAEYHAARERQSFIEGRVNELEFKISCADVIEIGSLTGNRVVFGATVKLVDEDTDEEIIYQIVGEEESSIKDGLLSCNAPIARAMIGKEIGDTFEVSTPKGTKYYEILKVSFEN
jgi:transcription elongation factor GreA